MQKKVIQLCIQKSKKFKGKQPIIVRCSKVLLRHSTTIFKFLRSIWQIVLLKMEDNVWHPIVDQPA